jgi:hypothetical protein
MHIEQISSGLEDLSLGFYRSPGVHASTLLSRLCVRQGHYEKSNSPISDRHREVGNAVEHAIAHRASLKYPDRYMHNPEILCDGIYITPDLVDADSSWSIKASWMSITNDPESLKMWKYMEQLRLELYALRRVVEGTAVMRPASVEYEVCVCDVCTGYLRADEIVIDANGEMRHLIDGTIGLQANYCGRVTRKILPPEFTRYDGTPAGSRYLTGYLSVCFINDHRPPQEQIPKWKIQFFPEELDMAWAVLLRERELYMESECGKCGLPVYAHEHEVECHE